MTLSSRLGNRDAARGTPPSASSRLHCRYRAALVKDTAGRGQAALSSRRSRPRLPMLILDFTDPLMVDAVGIAPLIDIGDSGDQACPIYIRLREQWTRCWLRLMHAHRPGRPAIAAPAGEL